MRLKHLLARPFGGYAVIKCNETCYVLLSSRFVSVLASHSDKRNFHFAFVVCGKVTGWSSKADMKGGVGEPMRGSSGVTLVAQYICLYLFENPFR